ncbi:hypothetical protein M501DRAFT_1001389 [Patellaria atrata CBS 101060]|uniref:Protein N-terminal and lysine N-methyltransferase EFM7 n=1 Tax=Patellaria atrata CBS 101060 TaxID=1346257 RepID=A0A9P4S0V4_9PEZI|nr:hypothetical protein M501DRAFT_1001389 [Patellaria atrata CBS 101060]
MLDEEDNIDLFQEPSDYYEPEKPATFAAHQLLSGDEVSIRLIGHSPLWGHLLWNAGRTVSHHLEKHAANLVAGKTILELGAGGGLPSLIAAISGASIVVVTDYPDEDLVENLHFNIAHCNLFPKDTRIIAEGYLWGAPATNLMSHLPLTDRPKGFDVLILADLLFNHSEHLKLVRTVQQTLKRATDARALVFFTPYRPWLLEKDLAFFELAAKSGFRVEKIFEKVMDAVMFEEDLGDELLRRTVYGYELHWEDVET